MSRRSQYRTSQEILDALFALPSDPENSTDDEESSDNDSDPSADITTAAHFIGAGAIELAGARVPPNF